MNAPTPTTQNAAPAKPQQPEGSARTTALLLQLEGEARAAETREALAYTVVNRTRGLIAYDQAIAVSFSGSGRTRIHAISSLPVIDRNAPYVVWLRDVLRRLFRDETGLNEQRVIAAQEARDTVRPDDPEWWPGLGLWTPWRRQDRTIGGLLLLRARPNWTEAEKRLTVALSDCHGHAWAALGSRRGDGRGTAVRRIVGWGAAATVLAAMALPVTQSVVAPARIVPEDPIVVAAPMDGVIDAVDVKPNQAVAVGDVLFRYVAAELEANLAVAERAVDAAEADLQRARQQAFGDPRSNAEVALKEEELALKKVELDYGRYLYSQVRVTADAAGVAVFSDPAEWRGRPVQTGVRVMQLADPEKVRVEIQVPVGDAVALTPGADVSVFLDIDPLTPLSASLTRAAYGAEMTEDGVLAYRASAALTPDAPPPRVGLHGTARIYGEPVPLGLFLFRKPISAARQYLGI